MGTEGRCSALLGFGTALVAFVHDVTGSLARSLGGVGRGRPKHFRRASATRCRIRFIGHLRPINFLRVPRDRRGVLLAQTELLQRKLTLMKLLPATGSTTCACSFVHRPHRSGFRLAEPKPGNVKQLARVERHAARYVKQRLRKLAHQRYHRSGPSPAVAFDLLRVPSSRHCVLLQPAKHGQP
jgi:hypothetical protein